MGAPLGSSAVAALTSNLSLQENSALGPIPALHAPRQISSKGAAWTEEEHRAFLSGLQAFGKGQWKQISRYYVPSRTPTQVASHAQKHFLRISGATKRRSRFAAVEENLLASNAGFPPAGFAGRLDARLAVAAAAAAAAVAVATASAPSASAPSTSAASGSLPAHGSAATAPLPPPAGTDGIALGIPASTLACACAATSPPHATPLSPPATATGAAPAQAQPTATLTTPGGMQLPLLPVLPGRIAAPMAYTQHGHHDAKPPRPSRRSAGVGSHPRRVSEAAGDVFAMAARTTTTAPTDATPMTTNGRAFRPSRHHQQQQQQQQQRRRRRPPAKYQSNRNVTDSNSSRSVGGASASWSKALSVSSDATTAAHSALDALAGVAAALADSAATLE